MKFIRNTVLGTSIIDSNFLAPLKTTQMQGARESTTEAYAVVRRKEGSSGQHSRWVVFRGALLLFVLLFAGCGGAGVNLESEQRFGGGLPGYPSLASQSQNDSQLAASSKVYTTTNLIVYARCSAMSLHGLTTGQNVNFSNPFLEELIHGIMLGVDNGTY